MYTRASYPILQMLGCSCTPLQQPQLPGRAASITPTSRDGLEDPVRRVHMVSLCRLCSALEQPQLWPLPSKLLGFFFSSFTALKATPHGGRIHGESIWHFCCPVVLMGLGTGEYPTGRCHTGKWNLIIRFLEPQTSWL